MVRRCLPGLLLLAGLAGLGRPTVVGAQGTFAGDSLRASATASHTVTINVTGLSVGRRLFIRREYKSQPGLPFDSIGVDQVTVDVGAPPITFTTPGPAGLWRYRLTLDSARAPLADQQIVRAGEVFGGTSVITPAFDAPFVQARVTLVGGGLPGMLVRFVSCTGGCTRTRDTVTIGDNEGWQLSGIVFPTPGLQQIVVTATDADGLADTVRHRFTTLDPQPPFALIFSPFSGVEPRTTRDSVSIIAGDSLFFGGVLFATAGPLVSRGWTGLVPGSTADTAGWRRFPTPGRFPVTLRGVDDIGVVGEDTVTILVRPVPFLTVATPAADTPVPLRTDIAGRALPGTVVRVLCARCSARDSTRTAAADSTWRFADVRWSSRVTDTLRVSGLTPDGDEVLVVRAVTFLPNQAPTATITSPARDTSVIVGQALTLTGAGTDPDGTIASGSWTLSDGRTFPTLAAGSVVFSALGTVTVSLVVVDDEGLASVAATRSVLVRRAPFLTVATPAAGASVAALTRAAGRALPGATVRLTCARCAGSGSTRTVAADSTWAFDSLSFTSAGADTLVVTATSAPFDTLVVPVPVTVRPAAFATITAPAAGGSSPIRPLVAGRALPGATVRLTCARCAANDSVRTALADSTWSFGPVLWTTAGPDTVRVLAVTAGPDSARAERPVVIRANERPVVTIVRPSIDTTVTVGDSLVLQGTATDVDGTVASVTWTLSDGRVLTGPGPFTVQFPALGSVTASLAAVDELGLAAITVTRTIQVLVNNQPPTIAISAPTAGASVAVGDTVRFSATVADPDNSLPLVVSWRFTPTDSATGTANVPFVFRVAGAVTVRATVRDARGGTATATVGLTVTGRGVNVDRTSPGSARRVDGFDVLFVIRRLGTTDALADVNGDGVVDAADVALVRAAFGRSAP